MSLVVIESGVDGFCEWWKNVPGLGETVERKRMIAKNGRMSCGLEICSFDKLKMC
jgi:hypothetical protein